MTLLTASGDRLEAILDDTYPVWGEGLSRQAYGQWNRGQVATAWGRDHLRRVALMDGSTILASAKRYDFEARAGGEVVPVLGIGAVFTPASQRRRGHARALIDAMVAEAEARGCRYALLFSEIGAAYYEAMGFQTVAREVCTIDVVRKAGRPPATFVRAGESTDLRVIAEISAAYATGAGFALQRTPDLIEFGIVRRRLLAGLGPAGLRQVEFFVAEEGHRAAAYVIITRGPSGAVLEECGDRDPSGARIGAILQVLAARTPAEAPGPMRTWLPPALRPPQVCLIEQAPAARQDIMMLRPLGGMASSKQPLSPVVYWSTDVF
jgi:predicted N-acetyltransferase YhbS